jgi:hypothetical protein
LENIKIKGDSMDFSWLTNAGQSMLPQSVGSAASNIGSNKSWLDAFSGNNMANIGNLMGNAGSLYGAYNSNKLGNASIDIAKQQNALTLEDYNQKKKDKASMNDSFASVWGK